MNLLSMATGSFWMASLEYWLLWLPVFLLASALYWFGYGRKYKDQIEAQANKLKKLEKLKPEIETLKNKQEHLSVEKKQLTTNLEELAKKHHSLKGYHESIQAKYQASTKQFEQANEERQTMLDSYESLEKNLEATEKQYNEALAKIDQLENELEQLEEQNPSSTAPTAAGSLKEIKRLEALLDSKEKTILTLQKSIAAKPAPTEKLALISNDQEVQEIKEQFQTAVAEKEKLTASYNALKVDYNQLRNTHATLNNKHLSLEAENKKITNKINALELSLNSTKANLTGESTNAIALKESNESLSVHHQHLEIKLEELEAQYQEKDSALKQLQLQYHTIEVQQKELTKIKYQLQNQLTKVNKDLSELTSVNDQLKGRYEILSEQYQQTLNSNKNLQESILNLEKNHSEKKGSLGQIERMLESLRLENLKLKEKNTELTVTKKQVDEELVGSIKELETLRPQLNAIKQNKTNNQSEVNQLKLKLQQQGSELLKSQAKLKSYIELRSANLSLDANNKNLNVAYNNIQKKYDGVHKEYLALKSQFQLLRDKYEHLENTSNNTRNNKNQLSNTNAKLASEITALREAQRKLVAEKLAYEKRLKEMEKHLSTPTKKSSSQSKTTQVLRSKDTIKVAPDNLQRIEGIGPKVEALLAKQGITTWKRLSVSGIGELKRILKTGGTAFQLHDPTTWPEQAELAAANKWAELDKLQKELNGGIREY